MLYVLIFLKQHTEISYFYLNYMLNFIIPTCHYYEISTSHLDKQLVIEIAIKEQIEFNCP